MEKENSRGWNKSIHMNPPPPPEGRPNECEEHPRECAFSSWFCFSAVVDEGVQRQKERFGRDCALILLETRNGRERGSISPPRKERKVCACEVGPVENKGAGQSCLSLSLSLSIFHFLALLPQNYLLSYSQKKGSNSKKTTRASCKPGIIGQIFQEN
jgi:hypothetical protein